MITAIALIASLAVILGAAIVFTNAVEMLGERMNMGQGAVGSILAAVGTAMPETVIPVVAILGALIAGDTSGAAGEIGVGAILGAPFLLATLAMFVIGISAIGFRRRRETGGHLSVDEGVTSRDIGFFLVFFALAAGAGIVELPYFVMVILAIIFVAAYTLYVRQTILAGGGAQGEHAPRNLIIWLESRWGQAPTWAVALQVLAAIAVMAVGAHFFVQSIEHVSEVLGIPAGLIALIIAPLATELPEKFNSIIWLRTNKDMLAFGNISGAMVFQSTIPVALGVLFTPWNLGFLDGLAAVLALVSGAVLFLMLKSKSPLRSVYLLGGGVMYAAFLVATVVVIV